VKKLDSDPWKCNSEIQNNQPSQEMQLHPFNNNFTPIPSVGIFPLALSTHSSSSVLSQLSDLPVSAAMTQLLVLSGDELTQDFNSFPEGQALSDGTQVDLRNQTSLSLRFIPWNC